MEERLRNTNQELNDSPSTFIHKHPNDAPVPPQPNLELNNVRRNLQIAHRVLLAPFSSVVGLMLAAWTLLVLLPILHFPALRFQSHSRAMPHESRLLYLEPRIGTPGGRSGS